MMIKTNPLNFFAYGAASVRVFGTPDDPLFMAKDVAEILEYKNTRQAIIKNVDEEDRFLLENERVSPRDPSKLHPHSTLINESGLYTLIFRSNKPEAIKFRKWITKEVIPSIRKTGHYSINKPKSQQQITLDMIDQATRIFERLGMDDRDEILLKDFARSALFNNEGRISEIKKENSEWSISRRLSEYYGITCKKTHNKCISFGRVMAKKYREINNEEPFCREQFVSGTVRSVKCYYQKDWERFGDDLMIQYFDLEEFK